MDWQDDPVVGATDTGGTSSWKDDPIIQGGKPVKDRGYGEEALRQLGLTGRTALEGGIGFLDTLASPIRYGINTIINPPTSVNQVAFGSNSDPIQWNTGKAIADKLGLPSPETDVERFSNATAGAMASGAGFAKGADLASRGLSGAAQKAAQFMAERAGTQIGLSGVSGGASEFVKENGGGPWDQLSAGILAPIGAAGVSRFATLAGRKLGNIFSPLTESGRIQAAGRVATDVAKEDAGAVASAIRNGEPIETAAQAAVPVGRAEFSGLEKIVGTRDPSAFGPRHGSVLADQMDYISTGMKDLNAATTPIRDAILTIAENSGKTRSQGILNYIDSELARKSNTGNAPLNAGLNHYRSLIEGVTDPTTGVASPTALYGIRKNAGVALDTLAKKEGWDKKVTSGVTRQIQRMIDDEITSASGIRTPSGGSAWTEQYMQPFSKEAQRLSGIRADIKQSKEMATAGGAEARRISRTDEAPFSIPNMLSRPTMALNALLKLVQGYGGEKTTATLADLMKPENKAKLAILMEKELQARAARKPFSDTLLRGVISGSEQSQ